MTMQYENPRRRRPDAGSIDETSAQHAGCVVGLFIAHATGAPIESRKSVVLIAAVGVEGDRYAEGRGFWSDPRWPDQELTLVESEVTDSLGLTPGDLRRNIVTQGTTLEAVIGKRAALGTAIIEGVRPCDPCAHIAELHARPGLLRALAHRGGLRARIVRGGRVALGDAVMLLPGSVDVSPRR